MNMSAAAMDERSIAEVVSGVSATLANPNFPTGDRAALRRMMPEQPLPVSFYRFAVRHLPAHWDRSEDSIKNWATLVAAMAIMSPNAHRPERGLGSALAEAGFSEARLGRLLQSNGDTRRTLLLRAARFLAAKHEPCDWAEGASLLLVPESNVKLREQLNRRIARNFYITQQESTR